MHLCCMTQTDELKAVIAAEASEWARGFVAARVAFLARTISKSGVLDRSLNFDINRQARAEAVELLIAFEEHGRFIDMKPTAQDKYGRQAIERIKDWVRQTGLGKFERGFIRRYGRRPKLDEDLLNKIAWGIAIRRSGGQYRRRRWWNKSKTAGISELFNLVAAALPAKVADQVKQTFQN